MKDETDIITSFTANMIGHAAIMYVKTFKTDFSVFISNVMCIMADNFQYHGRFIDTDDITCSDQKKIVHITDKVL